MRTHEQVFHDWFVMRPRGEGREQALQQFFHEKSKKRDQYNQAATRAGVLANWAYREMRKMQGEARDAEPT